MKHLLERLYFYAERYVDLPNKFIDTRFVLLTQLIFCLIIYSGIVTAQMRIVDRCVLPIPSTFIK